MGFHVYAGTLKRARARLGAVHRRPACRFCDSTWCHDLTLEGKRWPVTRCSGCNREVSMSSMGWFTISDDSGVGELAIPYVRAQLKGGQS